MHSRILSLLALMFLVPAAAAEPENVYDPLKVADVEIVSQTFEVKDAKRDQTIPVRVYLPETKQAAPVVMFSHGLGGSRDNNPYLGNQWAKRGYVVVFMQHAGSDEAVWKNAAAGDRMEELKKAASVESFMSRTKDIPAVIDALTAWNGDEKNDLHGRMDLGHIGMSGHSFGAVTTQAVAGESFTRMTFLEPRIKAAVMMSPSTPTVGDPENTFASINMPCLLMTGTNDDSPIGNMLAAERLKVFPNLKNAPAWQVVFDKAVHMSFGQRDGEADTRYHRAILALTTAFWDAELKGDKQALAWLNGEGAKKALIPEDKWEANEKAKGEK
jgi:predicted dienelactone hydrolase